MEVSAQNALIDLESKSPRGTIVVFFSVIFFPLVRSTKHFDLHAISCTCIMTYHISQVSQFKCY